MPNAGGEDRFSGAPIQCVIAATEHFDGDHLVRGANPRRVHPTLSAAPEIRFELDARDIDFGMIERKASVFRSSTMKVFGPGCSGGHSAPGIVRQHITVREATSAGSATARAATRSASGVPQIDLATSCRSCVSNAAKR